jgi:hypothetical protein
MRERERNQSDMPDVPEPDFVGSLCEIWSAINYAAYHLAYVRVYLQTVALQTDVEQLRREEQAVRDSTQIDLLICRAHLAAFFWQLDHVFEALRIAIRRGQKEHSDLKYFWSFEKRLQEIEQMPDYREINAYRNKAHEIPAIIGCAWDKDRTFLHHFLPSIAGQEKKEDIDMNTQLQKYFEFAANIWLSFAPGDFKETFPRNFRFTVTVPHSFLGELPSDLKGAPQQEVSIEAYDRENGSAGKEPEIA